MELEPDWVAIGALGNWGAACGTVFAGVVALRLARKGTFVQLNIVTERATRSPNPTVRIPVVRVTVVNVGLPRAYIARAGLLGPENEYVFPQESTVMQELCFPPPLPTTDGW